MGLPRRHAAWGLFGAVFSVIAGGACDAPKTDTTGSGAGSQGGGAAGTGGHAGHGGLGGQGGQGGAGSTRIPNYEPQGCKFAVAPRIEYLDWTIGKLDVGATPNIRRVRLGIGGNIGVGAAGRPDPAHSIGFGWQTDEGTLASEVTWGIGSDPSQWPAENRAKGVSWKTPAGLIEPNGDAQMHEVHVCGLEPSTTYSYRVGGGPAGQEVWSEVMTFTTAPADGTSEVTIAVNGDSRGQAAEAWRVYQTRLAKLPITAQLFSGDTIYLPLDQGEWEKWLDLGERDANGDLLTLGRILTLHTNGNHDGRGTLFFGNLMLPQDPKDYPLDAELLYSMDIGPVHVTVIDDTYFTVTSIKPEDKDRAAAWLDADLAAANENRANVPWIVTLHHKGPLSSAKHGDDGDVVRGKKFFMPLFDKYHVDMDMAGHDHDYERSLPVSGPPETPTVQADPKDGTIYVVCGGAGAPAYGNGTTALTATSVGFTSGPAIGLYVLLHATNTELKLTAKELRPDESDPVIDEVTITK